MEERTYPEPTPEQKERYRQLRAEGVPPVQARQIALSEGDGR